MTQTAMQEHIEWLESTIEIAQEQTPILVNVLKLCLNDATQRLAMEKEQIMDAWDNGWHEHMNPPNTYITSVKYYNETFKSE